MALSFQDINLSVLNILTGQSSVKKKQLLKESLDRVTMLNRTKKS